ncbi:MAG: formylglycine-generating enzyme family protein, partial [Myxococcales bacterium]|nr:formylglycine-generating enzyme family protein [Myxococcales bacterium]
CAAVPDAMAFVPGASVAMGCVPATGPACEADAQPLHVVALSPFLIDRYEVAVAQWKACADAGPCKAPQLTGAGCLYGAANKGLNAMNCITHTDAATYCKALGKRLPSEAEWELAARGGSGASNLPAEVRMARRGQLGADKASVWVGVRCVQEAK